MEKDIEMQKLEEAIHKYECAASRAKEEADEYADILSDADLDAYARTVYNDREKAARVEAEENQQIAVWLRETYLHRFLSHSCGQCRFKNNNNDGDPCESCTHNYPDYFELEEDETDDN